VGGVVALPHVAFAADLPPAPGRTRGRIGDERERRTGEHERDDEDFGGLGKHDRLLRLAMRRRPEGACNYFRARGVRPFLAITMACLGGCGRRWRRRLHPGERSRRRRATRFFGSLASFYCDSKGIRRREDGRPDPTGALAGRKSSELTEKISRKKCVGRPEF